MKAILALEDGRIFNGLSFTGEGETWGEVVFNTSMTGYQEVLTDPSYKGQMVTMTYPMIGNYGINPEDIESDRIQVSAFLVKEYQGFPSNFRSTSTLADYLKSQGILGIEQIDTRALTRHIRKVGAMRGFITTRDIAPASCVKRAKKIPNIVGQDLVKEVTTKVPYFWIREKPFYIKNNVPIDKNIWKYRDRKNSVVAFDFGIKYNILRYLEYSGFEILVVPATTSAETIKLIEPDGLFLSNGPGNPKPLSYAINTIKTLLSYRPIFGICLGYQLLALALDANTFKLKFGHRGVNQPVKNLSTGKVEITSQNHGFAVDIESLNENHIKITHINLNDNTLEGFRHCELPIVGIQYHPEASPGPHDSNYLFNDFAKMIKLKCQNAQI